MCFRPVLLMLLKTRPRGIPSAAFRLLLNSFKRLFVCLFVSVSVDMRLHCLCARVPAGRGTIEWPRPRGSLHSFHNNPTDLLCQRLPFTVPLMCPLPHMSLQLTLKTLQKKSAMNANATSCRVNRWVSVNKAINSSRVLSCTLCLGVILHFKSSQYFMPLHSQVLGPLFKNVLMILLVWQLLGMLKTNTQKNTNSARK